MSESEKEFDLCGKTKQTAVVQYCKLPNISCYQMLKKEKNSADP